ncbi:Rhomboid protease GluP [Balamuthia mandrillaris]
MLPRNYYPPVSNKEEGSGGGDGRSPFILSPFAASSSSSPEEKRVIVFKSFDGVFLIIILTLVCFLLDNVLQVPFMRSLHLYHKRTSWWQPLTSIFCHHSYQHLSPNLFFIYIFGRLVEESCGDGAVGFVFRYVLCGLFANLASLLLSSEGFVNESGRVYETVSVGASGSIFGLFVISLMERLLLLFRGVSSWTTTTPKTRKAAKVSEAVVLLCRNLIELFILGQFVLSRLATEVQEAFPAVAHDHDQDDEEGQPTTIHVNRIAHLGGALAGVLVSVAISRWSRRRRQQLQPRGDHRSEELFTVPSPSKAASAPMPLPRGGGSSDLLVRTRTAAAGSAAHLPF